LGSEPDHTCGSVNERVLNGEGLGWSLMSPRRFRRMVREKKLLVRSLIEGEE